MNATSLDCRKAWYVEAVKDSLVINRGLSEKEAERMLSAYRNHVEYKKYP